MARCTLIVALAFLKITLTNTKNENSLLLRQKRYLVFPEGSTLSVALCMTAQTTLPEQIFTEAINWGIAYELPNESSTLREFLYPKHIMRRRNRRDLYQKLETIMDSMGYDGRSCIFRALCESAQRFLFNKNGILEELMKIVFDFPLGRVRNWEPEEHRLYHWAYRVGREEQFKDCSVLFEDCSFSLIDLALGRYSEYLRGNT